MKLYTASKLSLAPFWKSLRAEWTEHEFTSRWLDEHTTGGVSIPELCQRFWAEDEEDVRRSDYVIVMGDPSDKYDSAFCLRGALVEVGIAIGCGIGVIVVGSCRSYGTWQYHKAVRREPTIEAVREFLAYEDVRKRDVSFDI